MMGRGGQRRERSKRLKEVEGSQKEGEGWVREVKPVKVIGRLKYDRIREGEGGGEMGTRRKG